MSSTPSEAERRTRIVEKLQADTGIDEVMIEKLVHAFYARVRRDELIGPIFATRIQDWNHHLQRLCQFWSSVILMTGRYHGSPMQKHMALPVEAAHFDRWLHLFRQTAHDVCTPKAAAVFIERAERIARSIEVGVASGHGVLLARDERLVRAIPEAAF